MIRTMELMEDLLKRNGICTKAEETRAEIFPAKGEKMPKVKLGEIHNSHAQDEKICIVNGTVEVILRRVCQISNGALYFPLLEQKY